MERARSSPPTSAQIYLWSIDVQQREVAEAINRTNRAVTAMVKGEVRLNPAAADYIAKRFDHQTAAELERLCAKEFKNHPKRTRTKRKVQA